MSEAEQNVGPVHPVEDRHAWREALRRRAAADGVTLHIPARDAGEWQPPEVLLPISADEASEAVIRMRRGDL